MNTATFDKTTIYTYLQEICDPEIPVLSIVDLGMIRDAKMVDDVLEIIITPTYTGCPAVDMIAATIKMDLQSRGFQKVNVTQAISPAWTTDWMTEAGKQKLKAYGIAPPNPKQQVCKQELFVQDEAVQCPRCDSWHTPNPTQKRLVIFLTIKWLIL